MTFLLKQIFDLIKLLNSETGHNQIAAGLALGFLMGMSPFFSLQGFLLILLVLIFRIQFGAASLAAFFFSLVAYVFDPLFHKAGEWILTRPSLIPLWTELYNMPIIPFTRFNNTVVMGSGIVGLLLFPALFFLFRWMVVRYKMQVLARFKDTKIWKAFKLSFVYKWYSTYETYKQ